MKNLIRLNLLFVILFVFSNGGLGQNRLHPVLNGTIYTGIEVGSKGVKMSVIEIGKDAQSTGAFTILKDTSVNTDFISFTAPTFSATLKGLMDLYQMALNDIKVPSKRIFTVISSGVKKQAEKENKQQWIDNLIDSFRILSNEPNRKVEVVDVVKEARLSHLGIVPASRRFNTFLLDIGSGNTKGGYFPYDNTDDFRLFQLNWGTKSTANATEKKLDGDNSLENFQRQLNRIMSNLENSELNYAINSSGAYPLSDNIAFSGGIAWAVATMIRPEMLDNPVVTVTYDDVVKFSETLSDNFKKLSPAYLSSLVPDGSDKKDVLTEVTRVQKVFDQRSLIAGTSLLLHIMRQFVTLYSSKNFYLIKNGQVGWISAYVDQSVSK